MAPHTELMPEEVSTEVVGLTNVTVVEEPSVTAFEYGPDESVLETVIVFTVAVRHGSSIAIVNSTLSAALAGAKVVEPAEPLLAIVRVFYTLTV